MSLETYLSRGTQTIWVHHLCRNIQLYDNHPDGCIMTTYVFLLVLLNPEYEIYQRRVRISTPQLSEYSKTKRCCKFCHRKCIVGMQYFK